MRLTKKTQKELLDYNEFFDLKEFENDVIECSYAVGAGSNLEIRYDGLKVCFFDILKNGKIELISKLI